MAVALWDYRRGPAVGVSLVSVLLVLIPVDSTPLTCHVCIPTMADPLRCQKLEYSHYAEPCATNTTSCATMYIPVDTSASAKIIFRGCAQELETLKIATSNCEVWPKMRNFMFLPTTYSSEAVTNRSFTLVGTSGERAEARRMLRNLFPRSDPTRINILRVQPALTRLPTPMQEMYTFHNYRQTTTCFCKDKDRCNDEYNSSIRASFSLSVVTVILFQFVYCHFM
ncbi:hypothetical protein RvY_02614 [Ramazzottius varieornatus]|uniref:UPAR/Ly6 domain-containing protein n=1 Tax=Ramazzottius varieornatus TaxID=947166 RepID=A0A1D1UKC7_RAMVA|nr:hypothetical protein RvY_02614 [Ramazzottius varieornatus]